jgi:chemotaxis protein histidine kinase CheA
MLMGYTQIGELCHVIEKLFLYIKQEKILLSAEIISAISDSAQGLHDALEEIKKDNTQIDLSTQKQKIESFFPKEI